MRTVPSLDRIITGFLLLCIVGGALLALHSQREQPALPVRAQLSASCGNSTSGETYGSCTTTADCSIGACLAGTCTEQCDGGACCSTACRFKTSDVICRNKVGPCDSPERCDGISASCPGDALFSAGTICRASAGVCDSPERCDGVTVDCPANIYITYAICRQATNECDLTESCNGVFAQCPANIYAPQGQSCGESLPCSSPMCDGRGRCTMVKVPDGTPCVMGDNQPDGICSNSLCVAAPTSSSSMSTSLSSQAASSSSSAGASSSLAVSSAFVSSASSFLPFVPSLPPPAVCGNRIVELDEQCEDGNTRNDDGCSAQCRFEPLYCCRGGAREQVTNAVRQAYPTLSAGSFCTDFGTDYDQAVTASRNYGEACLCGNGLLDVGEQCDGATFAPLTDGQEPSCSTLRKWTIGPLSCTPQCTVDTSACQIAVCGDSVLGPGEECDDAGVNTKSCDSDCSQVQCGDGLVNDAAGEECDDAWENIDGISDACRTNCTIATCGDGIVDSDDECDDGNLESGDGCNQFCRLEPIYCCEAGERRVVKGEIRQANPAVAVPGGDCPLLDPSFDLNSKVSLSSDAVCACGDGFLQLHEWCDGELFSLNADGASLKECTNVPWLGPKYSGEVRCSPDCTIDDRACRTAVCGDGRLDPDEECDLGIFAPFDETGESPSDCSDILGDDYRGNLSCAADCQLDTSACVSFTCGDGQEDPGEECDAGGFSATCDDDCTQAECGDGITNKAAGETCDDGRRNDDFAANACRTDCRRAHCGDEVLDAGEECDDGNERDGDGCSPGCRKAAIRQCNQDICGDCGSSFFCTRAACQYLGCKPGPATGIGAFFAALGNPLGLESYTCEVPNECRGR